MQIRIATKKDLLAICTFYKQVCEDQKYDQYGADWHWGIYPSKAILENFLNTAKIIIGIEDNHVISAGVLTDGEDPNYKNVHWLEKVVDSKVTVLHLFSVLRSARGHGIAQQMLKEIIEVAKLADYQVIHLDVMKGNLPAEKLYQKVGFNFVEEATIHYKDDGDTQAMMYERKI